MTKRDSHLVREIKKLEKMADKASEWDIGHQDRSVNGYAAGTIGHIQEGVYESLYDIQEIEKKEKLEKEREKWEERNKRPNPVFRLDGIIWNDLPWRRHPAHEEGYQYHVLRWTGSFDWKTFRFRSRKTCSEKNCIINAPVEIQEQFARMAK